MFLANDEGETVNYGHPNNYYNVWGINTDTENKEIVMKFVDWLYSEEGGYLMNYGVEGVHWEMVDRKPQFLDSIIEEYKSRTGDPTYEAGSEIGIGDLFLDMSWYSNYDAAFKTTSEESWTRENIHKVYADHMDDVILQGEFDKFAVFAKRIVDTTQGASVCALAGKKFSWPKAYVGTLPRVGEIDIEKVIDYIRKNPDDKWFLRPMVGKTPDPEEMEQLVKAGAPLAIHGFTKALQQAVKDDPRYELIERMCDVLMFFYEKDGVGAYWAIDDTLHNTNVADPKEYAKAINTVRQQQWLVHKFFTRYIPGFEKAQLLDTYANVSKAYHQTWEPSGFTEYDITPEEIKEGKTEREDWIVKILGHPMSGQNADGWYVPLAAMIPKGLEHILVTGKPACRKIHYIASCGLVGQAAGAAADGVGVVTPMFLGVTDKEMTAYYEKISSLVPAEFPIYLYNIPQCSGNDLKKTTAEQITENCENVIGIKYSYPDMMRTLEYLEIPNFSVLHGCDKMFAELLLMGCDGTVSGVAGVFPEPFVAVYEAWKHKDIPAMQKWQKVCIKLCNLLRCGANMSWFKQALALRGLPVGGMRAPQQDLLEKETADTMKEIEEICKEAEIELKV